MKKLAVLLLTAGIFLIAFSITMLFYAVINPYYSTAQYAWILTLGGGLMVVVALEGIVEKKGRQRVLVALAGEILLFSLGALFLILWDSQRSFLWMFALGFFLLSIGGSLAIFFTFYFMTESKKKDDA